MQKVGVGVAVAIHGCKMRCRCSSTCLLFYSFFRNLLRKFHLEFGCEGLPSLGRDGQGPALGNAPQPPQVKESLGKYRPQRSPKVGAALAPVQTLAGEGAALPAGIVESELFGHERGAFTGAVGKRAGRFALADGGTIFLDEVGDLPMDVQAKLLRVLQEGEFEPVGSEKTMKVDVRVIAATNRDLEGATRSGDFRTDLYYRLAVFPVSVPPLGERREDIPELVKLFVSRFSKSIGKQVTTIPREVMVALQGHTWPGNIRELQNVVERLIILTPDDTLRLDDTLEGVRSGPVVDGSPESEALEDVEREHILGVLGRVDWRVAGEDGAAGRLKMNPSTLRSRMAKLGIERPRPGG